MRYIALIFIFLTTLLSAVHTPPKGNATFPISKTSFKLMTKDGFKIVDLKGQKIIVVSVREPGSDGRFYAINEEGDVWKTGPVTSGAKKYRSPSGVFTIFQKKRFHMSTVYPDPSGVNNMDYMMKFTRFGHALHKGSVDWMSHGCIHIAPEDVVELFDWADFSTKVVVTRHSYIPFAMEDLQVSDKASIFPSNILESIFSTD
ncbi:L,D-transpeptidase [Sulfurovum sp. zt1-1]|uniref:L,D-transpeptidase n=1 Tax=Sulfurovum zhangzhouensis TaxID=3019067 RepID=A0ABT7QW66_9BACT|nr:L,D-transpeptidase [Sulfurovum zhangzhouensis]MDM5271079.1 L,D-transpeptidase [Sulfurovum zhangzhouensis]